MVEALGKYGLKEPCCGILRKKKEHHLSTGAQISPGWKGAQDGRAGMTMGADVGPFVGGEGSKVE